MTRSCRSSSPSGSSSKRVQPAAVKASQDIPKAACTRKGSFKHSKDGGKSKQFYMWRLRSLLPTVSGQDKVSELELVEATIAYIGYLQSLLQQQDDGSGDKEVDAPALSEMMELLRGLSVSS